LLFRLTHLLIKGKKISLLNAYAASRRQFHRRRTRRRRRFFLTATPPPLGNLELYAAAAAETIGVNL